MESVDEPKDLRYRSILFLMDTLDGSGELAQQAAEIVSHLEGLPTGTNNDNKD